MQQTIQLICVYAIPLILAITLHEAAHAWVARIKGDNTAYMLGRCTLNPVPHIDPVGTLLLPGAMLALSALSGGGGMLFGWAKPVPISSRNLKNPQKDMLWIALAGPMSNLIQALLWALLLKTLLIFGLYEKFFLSVTAAGISVNMMLMAFNLIPILPLDGGRILRALLPYSLGQWMDRLEPHGMIILLILIVLGLLHYFAAPFLWLGQTILSLVL